MHIILKVLLSASIALYVFDSSVFAMDPPEASPTHHLPVATPPPMIEEPTQPPSQYTTTAAAAALQNNPEEPRKTSGKTKESTLTAHKINAKTLIPSISTLPQGCILPQRDAIKFSGTELNEWQQCRLTLRHITPPAEAPQQPDVPAHPCLLRSSCPQGTVNRGGYYIRPENTHPLEPLPQAFLNPGPWCSGTQLLNWSGNMREGYAQVLYPLASQFSPDLIRIFTSYLNSGDMVPVLPRNLRGLNLSHYSLADEGGAFLQALNTHLHSNPRDREISGNGIYLPLSLETLFLNNCDISIHTATTLLDGLFSLRRLSLARNHLRRVPSNLYRTSLDSLDLSHNELTDHAIHEFGTCLSVGHPPAQTIKALFLNNNPYGYIEPLFFGMKRGGVPSLSVLSLAGERLTRRGLTMIEQELPPTVRYLGMSGVSQRIIYELAQGIWAQRQARGIGTPITVLSMDPPSSAQHHSNTSF